MNTITADAIVMLPLYVSAEIRACKKLYIQGICKTCIDYPEYESLIASLNITAEYESKDLNEAFLRSFIERRCINFDSELCKMIRGEHYPDCFVELIAHKKISQKFGGMNNMIRFADRIVESIRILKNDQVSPVIELQD